jgi:short-subunit dehydrogenase
MIMSKTIIVAGYGPGISNAVAARFGREGFSVALVARNAERLAAGVKQLAAANVKAEAFTADLTDANAIGDLVGRIKAKLGPINAIHWNAYAGGAGDLTTAPPAELSSVIGIATTSLVATVQASLADLRETKGAVLVTNGGFGILDPNIDGVAAKINAMGLSIANAAKRKLVATLAAKLAPDVYVGEVVVTGSVKGSAWDDGTATLEASKIADRFWAVAQERKDTSVMI